MNLPKINSSENIRELISAQLTTIHIEIYSISKLEQIIGNSIKPIELLYEACNLVSNACFEEQEIFYLFIQSFYSDLHAKIKAQRFKSFVNKLKAHSQI